MRPDSRDIGGDVAKRKNPKEPVTPAAATETGRLLVLVESLHTQFQHLGDGLAIVNRRLAVLEERTEEVPRRLDAIEAAVRENSTAIRGLETRLGRVEERLDQVEQTLGRVEQRLDQVEQRVGRVEVKLDVVATRAEVITLADRVTALERAS
jgi:chromosome segregation ATPase